MTSTPLTSGPNVIAHVPFATIALSSEHMVYLLTSCCGASVTGTDTVRTGVACRSCYSEQPEILGWAAMAADLTEQEISRVLQELTLRPDLIAMIASSLVANIRRQAGLERVCQTCGEAEGSPWFRSDCEPPGQSE